MVRFGKEHGDGTEGHNDGAGEDNGAAFGKSADGFAAENGVVGRGFKPLVEFGVHKSVPVD